MNFYSKAVIELRQRFQSAFFADKTRTKKAARNFHQLMSESGALIRSVNDAALTLRDFHERQVIRIINLYKGGGSPIEIAEELGELRKTLTVWSFRLAAKENPGNYALAIGGSVNSDMHTFITDVDAVVISAKKEDREAAKRVQGLMMETLAAINLEADRVMPHRFDGLRFGDLQTKFPSISSHQMREPSKWKFWLSNGSFYRFLMDIQIVDKKGRVKKNVYERQLDEYQRNVAYLNSRAFFTMCRETYYHDLQRSVSRKIVREGMDPTPQSVFDVKNDAVRLFSYALYAVRAELNIKSSSPWEILHILQDRGVITVERRKEAAEALRFFLELMHLIGISLTDTMDAAKLTSPVAHTLSGILEMDIGEFLKKVDLYRENLLDISEQLMLIDRASTARDTPYLVKISL
jgi:hypothetical protein